jgi:hypothetical protein
LSVFGQGSKTDRALSGQAEVLPGLGVPHAFLESARLDLAPGSHGGASALPPATLGPLAAKFRLSCTALEICRGAEELSACPADMWAFAAPLYAAELPVHCLHLNGQ